MEPDTNKLPDDNHDGRFVDERTRDKIRKHLNDPDDQITAQDIANVNTEMFKRPDHELSDAALKEGKKTEPDDEIAPKAPNTWDILED